MPKEWMPVNQCEDCESKANGCQQDCLELRYYQGKMTGQKKLLEYLIGDAAGRIPSGIGIQEFKRMLKQLEEQNG